MREEDVKTTREDDDCWTSSGVGLALGVGVGDTSTISEDDEIWVLNSLGDGVGVTSDSTGGDEGSTSTADDWLDVPSTAIDEDAMIALNEAAAHNAPSNVPAGATTTSSRATISPAAPLVSIRMLKVVVPVAAQRSLDT